MPKAITYTNNICSRCGVNLTSSCDILGKDNTFEIHTNTHESEDLRTYMNLAYVFAKALKEEGVIINAHDTLKDLDPDEYERMMS